jgi:hypothetical protein
LNIILNENGVLNISKERKSGPIGHIFLKVSKILLKDKNGLIPFPLRKAY